MTSNPYTITKLRSSDGAIEQDVARLLSQLSSNLKPLSRADLESIVRCPANSVLIAKDQAGAICGMLTLVVLPLMSGRRARLEDVVVDSGARGMGIGQALVAAAMEEATRCGAIHIDLTSSASRVAANSLYERMGFVKRSTNVYRFAAGSRVTGGRQPRDHRITPGRRP